MRHEKQTKTQLTEATKTVDCTLELVKKKRYLSTDRIGTKALNKAVEDAKIYNI